MAMSGKDCYGSEEKKWTEEPSAGERSIYLWLLLIASSPASPGRISHAANSIFANSIIKLPAISPES